MTELIFIRHAETDLAGTFCGHTDPSVNARGQKQIGELIARLMPRQFAAIYSSDLRRALETASSLAKAFSIPLTATPNLREIHFGEWEGMTWAEAESRDPDYARMWTEAHPCLPAPGGELFQSFQFRVLKQVETIRATTASKAVAVITHGGAMRVVLQYLLGETEQRAWQLTQSYCSSFVLPPAFLATEVGR